MSWQERINSAIRASERIVILGVGNPVKGDDGAGVNASEELKTLLSEISGSVLVISGGEVPENYTGVVRSFQPQLVIILDCAVSGAPPGTVSIVDPATIADDEISTHRIPLVRLVDFLETTIPCRVILLGIEPVSLEESRPLSKKVRRAVAKIVRYLDKAIREKRKSG